MGGRMAEPLQKIVRPGTIEKGSVLPTSHVTAPMPPVQPPRPAAGPRQGGGQQSLGQQAASRPQKSR